MDTRDKVRSIHLSMTAQREDIGLLLDTGRVMTRDEVRCLSRYLTETINVAKL